MVYSEFCDCDYFMGKKQFLEYISKSNFRKSYKIKFDPEMGRKRKYEYWDVPCSFDIETTSFYYNDEKFATMYLWGFNFNGRSVYGRTWEEFISLMDIISGILNTENITLICGIHNLSYEFNWFRKWFEWDNVFCMKEHECVKARTTSGIEFRCTLLESGKRLALLAEELTGYHIRKLDTLNYRGIRHSETPLTDLELMYQLNDVRIVAIYLYEKGKKRKGICNILATKTGYVRELFKKNTIENPDKNVRDKYRAIIRMLTMDPNEYIQAEHTFQGGFVHGSYLYIDELLELVGSFDEISAYPGAMLANMFPMSKGFHIEIPTPEDIETALKYYCCMFRWEVWDLKQKKGVFDNPISESHCDTLEHPTINNGRVKSADHLVTYITNVDYEIYQEFYSWDKSTESITRLWKYKKGFLPKAFIETVLELYENKTKLKGVKGSEELYMLSKENMNSSYGMMVMRILRDTIEYSNEKGFEVKKPDIEKVIEKENKSKNRFLFYIWGLFVTAYARKAILLGAIVPSGRDYVYSDTDSCKLLHPEDHIEQFNVYNEQIRTKLYACMDFYGFDRSRIEPKTIKGVSKLLGAFEYEHDGKPYEYFKTLGAKRYMTYSDGKLELTVAGLNKIHGAEFIQDQGEETEEWFGFFSDDMSVPSDKTGKLTHTYIDDEFEVPLTDMFNKTIMVHEKSAIHLEDCPFTLSLAPSFLRFLLDCTEER